MSEISTRQLILEFMRRHPRVTVKLLHEGVLKHLTIKAVERALANLQRDKLVRSFPGFGKEKIYTLTARGARRQGLDERRFRRQPNLGAIRASLTLLMFCVQEGRQLLTASEFAELLPDQAACGGLCHRRYYLDDDTEQPLLTMIIPDYARGNVKRVVRRVRREITRRKTHGPFRDLIYARLFQLVIVTPLESRRAEEIRQWLKHETYPHRVVAVPGMTDLVSVEERK